MSCSFNTAPIIAGLFSLALLFGCNDDPTMQRGFLTNDAFISGLHTGLHLDSADEVFDYVMDQIGEEVTVYPSENYYYFKFPASGKTVTGSLHLILNDPENMSIGLGYVHKIEDKHRQKDYAMPGESLYYEDGDGVVEMEMIDDFTCLVNYKDRQIVFHLYKSGMKLPVKAILLPEEEYVGPSFDESGLQFYLIYNTEGRSLYWILNEDVFVPEAFAHVHSDVVIGDRTQFAFYLDSVNNRKVLVGVEGRNVLHNNWYDGPFDQMPDNYVRLDSIRLLPYLEAHYPYHKGNMNRFGRFLDRPGTRVPVAPYRVYWNYEDLTFVDSLKSDSLSRTDFYRSITRQIFYVPDDYWY